MPFTALKPQPELAETDEIQSSCAPPNAVYGIETSETYVVIRFNPYNVVRRLMPFTALKLSAMQTLCLKGA